MKKIRMAFRAMARLKLLQKSKFLPKSPPLPIIFGDILLTTNFSFLDWPCTVLSRNIPVRTAYGTDDKNKSIYSI